MWRNCCVQVLADDGQSVLNTMREIRSVCINQVLGTDMKKHFDIASRFQVGSVPLDNFAVLHIHKNVLFYTIVCISCCALYGKRYLALPLAHTFSRVDKNQKVVFSADF